MNKSTAIYQNRINQVIDYINSRLNQSFSIEELAGVAHFSPFHFHRIFLAITGETVNAFTNRVRLEKAARLLRFSKKSVADIAYETGFSSPAIFSRAFKQHFGFSASQYRNGAAIENSKISKEVLPFLSFIYSSNGEELASMYPVEIREWPARTIAYIRLINAFGQGLVPAAYEEMIQWAKAHQLYETETIFGMSVDDPMVTPAASYRYEVGITIPEGMKPETSGRIELLNLPATRYAVTRAEGDIRKVATGFYFLFNHWLINSEWEPEQSASLEIYRDKNLVNRIDYFDMDLCIPVKPIRDWS